LLPAEQFRTLILHECARCDRNAHAFSLIQIDLRSNGNAGKDRALDRSHAVRQLARTLAQRKRSTDEVGWLDSVSVGVFLPETGVEGARRLARDACQDFSYQIYTYPCFKDVRKDLDSSRRRRRRDESDQDSTGSGDEKRAEQLSLHSDAINRADGQGAGLHAKDSNVREESSVDPIIELVMPAGAPVWKRFYDIIGSSVLLLLLSPLFALVALYIKIVSPGPVFFRQERIGYLGRPFTIWKFRTMKVDADENLHMSHLKGLIQGDQILTKLDSKTDCRWIPCAGLLRKSCLDELPQLFNVLKGEMSLIGPRPVPDYEVEEYSLWQRQRFHSLPGMTGLWQVSGKNRLTFSQMMRLDARYSRKFNFAMDLVIFFKTVPAILGQVKDSIGGKRSDCSTKGKVSVWRRSLNDFVRQVFL